MRVTARLCDELVCDICGGPEPQRIAPWLRLTALVYGASMLALSVALLASLT